MQHDLVGVLGVVARVTLVPVVRDGISEDVAITVEGGAADGAANLRVALQTVLCVLVPEVESAVTTGSTESAVYRMKGDGVDRIDIGNIALTSCVLAVTFKGEVGAKKRC